MSEQDKPDAAADNTGKKEFTRGQQTAWIVGTILFIAVAAFLIWRPKPDTLDPYRSCMNFFGFYDQDCKAKMKGIYDDYGLLPPGTY